MACLQIQKFKEESMDISIMTVSIPVDTDTLKEIQELIHYAFIEDQVDYAALLSVDELSDTFLKGFCVLAYDDDTDKLVGVISAIDRIATLDFEWSAVVLPSVRRQGIGEQLIKELTRNLDLRGATEDIALVPKASKAGQQLISKFGYVHDFSERTMAADAVENEMISEIEITPYSSEELELIELLASAFGDTEEEARELIAFNTQTPNRKMMLALINKEVVGTVSIVEETEKLWVTGLAVHEKARGKGIATSILNWSKNEAHRLGKAEVLLDVETDNEDAISVYKKVGFKTINFTHFYRKG